MQVPEGKKIYFLSDFHLGLPKDDGNHLREQKICNFLRSISADAHHIYLMGDIFDTWFEYRSAVPKGFVRFLGTLASLRDQGIGIEVFTGNHDMWMFDYFKEELDIDVHHQKQLLKIHGKTFLLAHGDGLGPFDKGYKMLKKVLRNKTCQWLYRLIHPDIGIPLAQYFSRKGAKHDDRSEPFLGEEKEWLVLYAKEQLKTQDIDFFIFGHRHLALDIDLGNGSRYVNLGDWIILDSYAVFDGKKLELLYYKE